MEASCRMVRLGSIKLCNLYLGAKLGEEDEVRGQGLFGSGKISETRVCES